MLGYYFVINGNLQKAVVFAVPPFCWGIIENILYMILLSLFWRSNISWNSQEIVLGFAMFYHILSFQDMFFVDGRNEL